MAKLWMCDKDFLVQGKGFNLYVFHFSSEEDKKRVAKGAPWFVANQHIIVKEWLPNLSWDQVDLGKSCMWIQVHGLPLEQMNEESARVIDEAFAGLLETNISLKNVVNPRSYIRLKVGIWVDRPLLTGFHNVTAGCEKSWVRFQYENLPELCWFCGRLGHQMQRCPSKGANDKLPVFDIPERGYGPWLKAEIPLDEQYGEILVEEPTKNMLASGSKRKRAEKVENKGKGKKVWKAKSPGLTEPTEDAAAEAPAPNPGPIHGCSLPTPVSQPQPHEDFLEYDPIVACGNVDRDLALKLGYYVDPIQPEMEASQCSQEIAFCEDKLLEYHLEKRSVPLLLVPPAKKWKECARGSTSTPSEARGEHQLHACRAKRWD
ncbi:hypothetical protein Tsubulata_020882 [Turnera subulata]|uniref:CCHC-type domain-containing protein n=1 Tax=Turnera subulata TaxID=218843 RepID=A0A9Q0FJ41_9ROSI|nr:hypothetical protein Tsubulata_020882 [Turnera subulata]